MPRCPAAHRSILALAAVLLLGLLGCESAALPTPEASWDDWRPPLHRSTGERLPPFGGGDPAARGWVQVDGLLWIEARDLEAWRRGEIFDGARRVSRAAIEASSAPAARGLALRTDHVALRTNASWTEAFAVAREAESHVRRLVGSYGNALDLRLPDGPLRVVATRTRAEFEDLLRRRVRDPVAWGAFYDARSGVVMLSLEPCARGPLPWIADLRHELTHQVVDLSRPASRRGRPYERPWFWLWEGLALWSEELGSASGALVARQERFRRRIAWGQATPLAELVTLEAERFEGPHYDQVACWMHLLMQAPGPHGRQAVLAHARRLQGAAAVERTPAEVLGQPLQALERLLLEAAVR